MDPVIHIFMVICAVGLLVLLFWLFAPETEPILCKCCGHAVNAKELAKNGCPKCGDFP